MSRDPRELEFTLAVVEGDVRDRGRLARLLRNSLDVDEYSTMDALEQRLDGTRHIVVFGPTYADETGLSEKLFGRRLITDDDKAFT